jgi:hypothetical protein
MLKQCLPDNTFDANGLSMVLLSFSLTTARKKEVLWSQFRHPQTCSCAPFTFCSKYGGGFWIRIMLSVKRTDHLLWVFLKGLLADTKELFEEYYNELLDEIAIWECFSILWGRAVNTCYNCNSLLCTRYIRSNFNL